MRDFRLSPEGWLFVLPAVLIGAVALLIQWYFAAIVCATIAALFVSFFRDRKQTRRSRDVDVLAPADGTVVEIRTVDESEAAPGLTQQISIVTSIFDVHANRAPVNGKVVSYRPSRESDAGRRERKRERTDENLIVLRGRHGDIAIRQVAGLLARRIVFEKREGDAVAQGERIGMIRFGSRVDLFLPSSARIGVKMRDKVKVGITILAELESEA
jgi:phosphatidylserine decarboxylase